MRAKQKTHKPEGRSARHATPCSKKACCAGGSPLGSAAPCVAQKAAFKPSGHTYAATARPRLRDTSRVPRRAARRRRARSSQRAAGKWLRAAAQSTTAWSFRTSHTELRAAQKFEPRTCRRARPVNGR